MPGLRTPPRLENVNAELLFDVASVSLAIGITPATVVVRFTLDETLVFEPEIVEEFGQVLVAGIAGERNHAFRVRLLPAIFERCAQQRAGRRTGQHTFFTKQFSRRAEGLRRPPIPPLRH